MNARRLVIAGIALAVLIAVVAIVFDQLAVRSGQTTAQASNSASPTSGGDGANGSGAGAQSSGSPTSGAPPTGARPRVPSPWRSCRLWRPHPRACLNLPARHH